jgi:hypothetical protein
MAIKAKICKDPYLITKILFTIDTCIQLWLSGGRSATDREEMDDGIIDLPPTVINLMDQLVVSLPPCLTLTVRKPREEEYKEPHPNPKKTKRHKDNKDPN